ncbi:hypothetical protein FB451DRAFT_1019622 [Mycena latifolia]|nr:hypothetical protein FB451DRAFT_1019622 [Mycena latifolia]
MVDPLRSCFNCGTTTCKTWRRSRLTESAGKALCNKCGLYESTHSRPRPEQTRRGPSPVNCSPQTSATFPSHSLPYDAYRPMEDPLRSCFNCGTTTGKPWRRSRLAESLCNKCGLYESAHSRPRPEQMRRGPSPENRGPQASATFPSYSLPLAQSQVCTQFIFYHGPFHPPWIQCLVRTLLFLHSFFSV